MTTQTQNNNIETIYKNQLFKEFCMIRNLKKSSQKSYAVVLNSYTQIQQTSIDELIQEADDEEEQGIRISKRKIKTRLINYKMKLQEQKLSDRTINDRITKIRTFYAQFDITPPKITRNKVKVIETYQHIIKPKQIRKAVQTSKNNKTRAIILFMASSGTAAQETSNITIQDFIDATREYHQETRIEQVIYALKHRDDIIPTWNIIRQKTQTPYFTFCSPEATQQILTYLAEELMKRELKPESKLFNISAQSIQTNFERLNDACMFGWKNDHCRFFHSHGLRKMFGSRLFDAGLSDLTIDFLEGRSVGDTKQAYYKPKPDELKKKYMRVLDKVTFFNNVEYHDITSSEKEELIRYREKEKVIDEKIRNMEQLLNEYMSLSSP